MKQYLFIYPSLSLGGIETFFVRLAKQFAKNNRRLKFLFLFKNVGNHELMCEIEKFADIYYWEDFCFLGGKNFIGSRFKLFMPLRKKRLREVFSGREFVHVSCALTYFTAMRVFSCLGVQAKFIFGVYHSNELAWGQGDIPLYERYFRKYIFGGRNLLIAFFNSASQVITLKNNGVDNVLSKTFPLGINLASKTRMPIDRSKQQLRIISVGRLTAFKTYNLYMLDVVKALVSQNYDVRYDVYGAGPLHQQMQDKIATLCLQNYVALKGELPYSSLDETLKKYDVFVGTGTALLQAASNGIPCVTAIENEPSALSYGFFSDLSGTEYHEQNLNYVKKPISELLISYASLTSDQVVDLENNHFQKSTIFGIEVCADNFLNAFNAAPYYKSSRYPFYIYMAFFSAAELIPRLVGKSEYRKKYERII